MHASRVFAGQYKEANLHFPPEVLIQSEAFLNVAKHKDVVLNGSYTL